MRNNININQLLSNSNINQTISTKMRNVGCWADDKKCTWPLPLGCRTSSHASRDISESSDNKSADWRGRREGPQPTPWGPDAKKKKKTDANYIRAGGVGPLVWQNWNHWIDLECFKGSPLSPKLTTSRYSVQTPVFISWENSLPCKTLRLKRLILSSSYPWTG